MADMSGEGARPLSALPSPGARLLAFITILIGGACGLSDVIKQRASTTLALAPWTLPHELARLVLAEQLYRAGTIGRGEPYHK